MRPALVCVFVLSAAGAAGASTSPVAPAMIAEAAVARVMLASLPAIPRADRIRPWPAPAPKSARPEPEAAPPAPLPRDALCLLMESEARVSGLPPVFFVRLIWQESRFDPHAVSPVGASGIAQFMPATAAERGLDDPFHPLTALGASAALLRDLVAQFGNIGLAAAAYNAGPGRVQRWLAGKSGLPAETRHYVRTITGREARAWREPGTALARAVLRESEPVQDWCRELPVITLPRPRNAPEAAEAPPAPAWGVQLAAYFSEHKARAGVAAVRAQHGKLLGRHRPQVVSARAPARGRRPLYALRVLTETRAAAHALCAKLKSAGGECLVLRN